MVTLNFWGFRSSRVHSLLTVTKWLPLLHRLPTASNVTFVHFWHRWRQSIRRRTVALKEHPRCSKQERIPKDSPCTKWRMNMATSRIRRRRQWSVHGLPWALRHWWPLASRTLYSRSKRLTICQLFALYHFHLSMAAVTTSLSAMRVSKQDQRRLRPLVCQMPYTVSLPFFKFFKSARRKH